jgi:hypothetical protein
MPGNDNLKATTHCDGENHLFVDGIDVNHILDHCITARCSEILIFAHFSRLLPKSTVVAFCDAQPLIVGQLHQFVTFTIVRLILISGFLFFEISFLDSFCFSFYFSRIPTLSKPILPNF